MKRAYSLLLLSLTFFSRCGERDGIIDKQTSLVREFPDSISTLNFSCDTLPLSLSDADGVLKEDSLFIFYKLDGYKKVHLYGANRYDSLGAYITKGRGPGEVQLFGPRMDQVLKENGEIKVVIQSFPHYVALLNISKSLKEDKPVFDKKYDFTTPGTERGRLMHESSMFQLLSDGKLFSSENPNLSKGKIINPKMFIYDYELNVITDSLSRTSFEEENFKHSLMGACYQGVKGDDYKVCVAFRFIPAIKIFDFRTKKNIVVKMSKEYPFSETGKEASTNLVVTSDYIFRLSKERGADDRLMTLIHVLTWDGEVLGWFNMGDNINSIYANKADQAIYALSVYSGRVYKFSMKELWN